VQVRQRGEPGVGRCGVDAEIGCQLCAIVQPSGEDGLDPLQGERLRLKRVLLQQREDAGADNATVVAGSGRLEAARIASGL
jgi:hypothetical protein